MDLLLDTNVVIDHFGNRPGFVDDANQVFCMGAFGDVKLWVVPQSLNDAFYILRKVLSPAAIQDAFAKSLSFVNVCPVSHGTYARATQQAWSDMEDCLIALCAEDVNAQYIITRDKAGFVNAKVKAVEPKEIVAIMRDKYGLSYEDLRF